MTHANHISTFPTRRAFLTSASTLPVAAILAAPAIPASARTSNNDFTYEITRSDEEWRARLTEQEYAVLRLGRTEVPHTSLNAFQMAEGHYTCKGCDLVNFDSRWKVQHFDLGWAFFSQARPTTVLTSIDDAYGDMADESAAIECHCRRCASHLGHILTVKGTTLHCLNGTSLVFFEA